MKSSRYLLLPATGVHSTIKADSGPLASRPRSSREPARHAAPLRGSIPTHRARRPARSARGSSSRRLSRSRRTGWLWPSRVKLYQDRTGPWSTVHRGKGYRDTSTLERLSISICICRYIWTTGPREQIVLLTTTQIAGPLEGPPARCSGSSWSTWSTCPGPRIVRQRRRPQRRTREQTRRPWPQPQPRSRRRPARPGRPQRTRPGRLPARG